VSGQCGGDFLQLDAEPPDFDLVIEPPKTMQPAILSNTTQIPCQVKGGFSLRCRGGILKEACSGELWLPQIPGRNAGAKDGDFTGFPCR
jgi:hypothetical protein